MVENKIVKDHQSDYGILINSLPFKVFIKDLNLHYTNCNTEFAKFLRLPINNIIGKTDFDILPSELANKHKLVEDKILAGLNENVTEETYKIHEKDYSIRTVVRPIKNEHNEIIGVLGTLTDLSNNKKTAKKFENIFQTSIDGFCITDTEFKIIYVNDVVCQMLGYKPDELLGKNFNDFEEKQNGKNGYFQKATSSGYDRFETTMHGKNNKTTYVEISLTYSFQNEGEYVFFIRDISDRIIAGLNLIESKKRYQNLAEIYPVGIFHTDVNGQTTYVNSRWCEISGMSYEDALGDGWLEIVHPEDRSRLINNWEASVESHEDSITDYRFLRKDGSVVWVMGKAVPETKLDGEIVGYLGTIVDITKRKHDEELLRQSEKLYREVVEYSSDLIYSVNVKGQFIFANNTALSVSGYSLEELKNLFYYELVLPEYRPKLKEFYLNQIDKKIPTQYLEFPFKTKNGEIKWFGQNTNIKYEGEQIVGFHVIARDITERKNAEEALLQERILLRTLIDNLPDAIYVKDEQGRKTVANLADIHNMELTSEDEVLGKNDFELFPKEIAEKFYKDDQTVLQQGESILNREEFLFDPDGNIKWLLTSKIPLRDDKGNIYGLVGIGRDITKKKSDEKALKNSEHLLKASQRVAKLGHYSLDISAGSWSSSEVLNEIFGIDNTYDTTIEGWLQIVHPDDRDKLRHYLLNEVILNKTPFDNKFRIIRFNDGIVRWVRAIGELEFDESGNPIRMIGAVRDITERMDFEEALASERNLLRTLIDNMPDRIYAKDTEGRFIICNQALAVRMGVSDPEDVIGKSDFDLINRDLAEQFRADELEIMLSGQPLINREEPIDDDTGKRRWNLTTKVPLHDKQGKIIGIVGLGREITERKLAEQALQESEERFRTLYENSTVGIYRTTPEGRILLANPTLVKILGFSSFEELSSRDLSREGFKHSVERTKFIEKIEKSGEIIGQESKWKKNDGTIVYIRESGKAVRDESGKTIYYDGTVEDITEKKQAELALLESQNQLSTAMEIALLGYWEYDVLNDQFTFNDQFYKLFHTDVQQVGGYTMTSADYSKRFVYPEDVSFVGEQIKRAFESTEPGLGIEAEHRIVYADGEIGYVTVRIIIVKDNEGHIIKSYGVNQDITERKLAEEKIKQSENEYRTLFENAHDAILVFNAEDEIVLEVNEEACELYGYSKSEFIGMSLELITKDVLTGKNKIENILKEGYINNFETVQYTKKGEQIIVEINASLIDYKGNKAILSLNHDITKRKKAEKEMISAKEKAEEMNRLKTIFLTNMSHELRTPLIGLLGLSESLTDDVPDDFKESMIMINKSGLRLLHTLSSILDYSKIESEKMELIPKKISLNNLLREQSKLFQPLARTKGVTIVEKLSTEEIQIITDEKLLYDLVNNLINNAVKFTFKGTITLLSSILIDEILISITDTGIGIPEDKLAFIFEEFRQVSEGANRSFEGTGLGLTLVKKYVDLMNGSINVKSKLGEGTTFIIRLPISCISNNKEAEFTVPSTDENSESKSEDINRKKILLVEDDSISRITIEKMLYKNYSIKSVANAASAIENVNKEVCDAILMDINLGRGMDGIEATKEIRKIKGYEEIPIIAMTAYAMDEDKEEFLRSGCSHYISKPFAKKEILEKLDSVFTNL